jgi:hypothetical protein
MNKKEAVTASERVGSREAVERAIERSKDGPGANWEKQAHIPKWGQKRRPERPLPATEKRA